MSPLPTQQHWGKRTSSMSSRGITASVDNASDAEHRHRNHSSYTTDFLKAPAAESPLLAHTPDNQSDKMMTRRMMTRVKAARAV